MPPSSASTKSGRPATGFSTRIARILESTSRTRVQRRLQNDRGAAVRGPSRSDDEIDRETNVRLVDARVDRARGELVRGCLLYTSDAADEEDSVDLGGR